MLRHCIGALTGYILEKTGDFLPGTKVLTD